MRFGKREEPKKEQVNDNKQGVQIIEREVTLSLINDKLNYITGVLHKIADENNINLD